jgi:hypothetical protein
MGLVYKGIGARRVVATGAVRSFYKRVEMGGFGAVGAYIAVQGVASDENAQTLLKHG